MSKKEVKFNCKIVKCMYNSEDYKIYATDVDKKVQFTASSGRHSVLEGPFSETNGRPFFS